MPGKRTDVMLRDAMNQIRNLLDQLRVHQYALGAVAPYGLARSELLRELGTLRTSIEVDFRSGNRVDGTYTCYAGFPDPEQILGAPEGMVRILDYLVVAFRPDEHDCLWVQTRSLDAFVSEVASMDPGSVYAQAVSDWVGKALAIRDQMSKSGREGIIIHGSDDPS